jgi:uncharacterized protein (DUF952 family)
MADAIVTPTCWKSRGETKTMDIILHIARQDDWEKARRAGSYQAGTLASQGFIHCSTPEQVVPVANALFPGQEDLVLLCIDTRKTGAEIRHENLEGGEELFPHVYGPLDVEAVVRVLKFKPEPDGTFTLPEGLSLKT